MRTALANAREYLRDGVGASAELLRSGDRLVIIGAIGYSPSTSPPWRPPFMLSGRPALPIGLLVLAYTLGHGGAMVPIPGSAEGGLIGMFVLYGMDVPTATAAVLAYRALHAGVPIPLGTIGLADVRRLLRDRTPNTQAPITRFEHRTGGRHDFGDKRREVVRARVGVQDAGAQRLVAAEDGAGDEGPASRLEPPPGSARLSSSSLSRWAAPTDARGRRRWRSRCGGQLELGLARSTSVASSRASAFARATWAAIPARPRAAMVAHVLRARNGLVCSKPCSAKVPTRAPVSWRR